LKGRLVAAYVRYSSTTRRAKCAAGSDGWKIDREATCIGVSGVSIHVQTESWIDISFTARPFGARS
jgi:hypothetical protein